MKKIILTCLFLSTLFSSNAQFFNVGIKGGLNYNTNGDLVGTISNNTLEDYFTSTSNGDYGYHIGAFAELKLPFWLYVRPELIYTHTESYYDGVSGNEASLSINKMDIPVLVGVRLIKILRLFIGPSFQYILNTDFDFEDVKAVDYDDFTVGLQLGAGLEFGRFGFDVRWEQGLSDSTAYFAGNITDTEIVVDTRPSQIIFGVYWKFLKKKK